MSNDIEVESAIATAFADAPLGRAGRQLRLLVEVLSDARALDGVRSRTDVVEVLTTDMSIDGLPAKVMFLEAPAWCALLPAWMVAAMKAEPGNRAEDIRSAVLGTLDPKFSEKTPEIVEERQSQLSTVQREAVARFVRWAAEQPSLRHPKSKALVDRLLAAWPSHTPLLRAKVN
jgi:hypothetical protein